MKNIYTRFFVYLTCCVLLVSFFVSPASAASFDQDLFIQNYFDYNSADTYYVLTPDPDCNIITFPLHQVQYVRYVELYIASGQGFNSVKLKRGSILNDLTIIDLGSGYYKLYGYFTGGKSAWSDSLTFVFDIDKNTQIQIWSFRYSLSVNMKKELVGTLEGYTDTNSTVRKYSTNPGTTDVCMFDVIPSDKSTHMFVDAYASAWKGYDYLDFFFAIQSSGIETITADCSGIMIPCEISFVEATNPALYGYSFNWVNIRLDLREIPKNTNDYPVIRIVAGTGDYYDDYFVALWNVYGGIDVDNQSPLSTWFTRLFDFLGGIFSTDSNGSDQSGFDMQGSSAELYYQSDALNNLETPDINASQLTGNFTNFATSGLTVLSVVTANPYVSSLLLLVFTFALCAYIFFGKRR